MIPVVEAKPSQWSAEDGAVFGDCDVADAYPHRPPYPEDAIRLLARLAGRPPGAVLDAGCGTGDLARRLAPLVARVDAVDPSAAMLAKAAGLPGGDHPRLRWQQAPAESAELTPPYTLVTAGESLHWMDWPVVCARFAGALAPGGVLVIVERDWDGPPALAARLRPIFARYSTVRNYRRLDLVAELERRGLFSRVGERRCGPQPWRPTVDEYLECRHSQRGLARSRMDSAAVVVFDREVRDVLGDVVGADGRLELPVTARAVWGQPGLR
jgi:SAM-dependent methyltransferase